MMVPLKTIMSNTEKYLISDIQPKLLLLVLLLLPALLLVVEVVESKEALSKD